MRHILTVTLLLSTYFLAAQDGHTRQASLLFEDYEYVDAIDNYSKLVDKGHSNKETYKKLGDANYYNAKYTEAAEWYGKLVKIDSNDIEPEYYYLYAQALKSQERYKESDKWMQKFMEKSKNDSRALRFNEVRDYLNRIEKNSDRYIIRNMSINSEESDFAPSFYGENLVFSTARDSGIVTRNIHVWNKQSFLNLYKVEKEDDEYTNVDRFSKKLNTKAHESSTAFTNDGETLYFTRNNSDNGAFSRDEIGISRLKIYRAKQKNGKWGKIKSLPFNDDNYSVAHPALSPDGKKLYFASDMPGTQGESDIWYVDIHEDGTYGEPQNLGPKINTEARETFPFITASNILYFASDGHPGLGGLDMFATSLDVEGTKVINLGKPLNSTEDDFSFIIDEDSKEGFFASNRSEGKGQDDIYGFREIEPLNFSCDNPVLIRVLDANTRKPLVEADVDLVNKAQKRLGTGATSGEGYFEFEASCMENNFTLYCSKEGYHDNEMAFTLSDDNMYELLLEPIKKEVAEEERPELLEIDPIYFDFDQSVIRYDAELSIVKVLAYLNKHPNWQVQVSSHTDSRGSKAYNLKLSKNRAEGTKKYLIAQGISPERIIAEGFGEEQLVNECDDNTPCPESKHRWNRRSEFDLND